MLKKIAAAVLAVATPGVAAVVLLWPGASAAEQQPERFTTYLAPGGVEMAAGQAQSVAVHVARLAGQTGALRLTSVHSTFGQAHALLMGTAAATEESGQGERAEEMRSDVWVTSMTAPAGQSFTPIAPVPRGRRGPSGTTLVVVSDAHTGFVKEEFVGPSAPSVTALGTTVTASVAAEPLGARSARRSRSAVAPGRDKGFVEGRLEPARVGVTVTLAHPHGLRVAVAVTKAAGFETRAGSFTLSARAGTYLLSAPGCRRREVKVAARDSTSATLHCAPLPRP